MMFAIPRVLHFQRFEEMQTKWGNICPLIVYICYHLRYFLYLREHKSLQGMAPNECLQSAFMLDCFLDCLPAHVLCLPSSLLLACLLACLLAFQGNSISKIFCDYTPPIKMAIFHMFFFCKISLFHSLWPKYLFG